MTILRTSVLAAEMAPRLFDLDFQLLADAILTIIAVFVLFLALSYFLFNPARAFLAKRQEKIAGELENARTKEEEAAALKEEYEAKLENINAEADAILADARRRAVENQDRIIAQAREDAQRLIEYARNEANLEKQKLADDVKKEMINLATAMAAKIACASVDEEKQDALVNETLAEIGDNTWLS